MAEKSGIEKFFDIGLGVDMLAQEDPLSWENISNRQVGVDGNELVERKPGGTGEFSNSVGVTASSMATGRIDCLKAKDCGSGYVCVNGECVLNVTAGQSTGGGVTTTECAVDPLPPANGGTDVTGCYGGGPACVEGPGPGDCNYELPEFELDCCGKQKYRCCNNGECWDQCFECFSTDFPPFPPIQIPGFPGIPGLPGLPPGPTPPNPFPPPPIPTCDEYGGAQNSNFGDGGGGCGSDCAACVNGICEKKPKGSAPCFCYPDSCGDCKSCKDDGACGEPPPGQCQTCCNCSVWCDDCKERIYGRTCIPYPHISGNLACPAECRRRLAEKCPSCPPPPDPCKDDPNDPCDVNCRCVTRYFPCDDPPPCSPGKKCSSFGGGDVGGKCFDIIRECDPPPDNCDPDDCTVTGCGECQVCGSEGKCVPDPDCDDPPCEGDVCDDGTCCSVGGCKPTAIYVCRDTCHGNTKSLGVPAGASPRLSRTNYIKKDDAICNRGHSHCNISVCGRSAGSHLDCGKGCSKGESSTLTTCSDGC